MRGAISVTENIKDIFGKKLLFFDGAMGTQLQAKGLLPGEMPEVWNLTRKEDILSVHRAYIAAGCDILKTNTFGANPIKYTDGKYDVSDLVCAGIAAAREAADEVTNRKVYVAHSIGPLGKLLRPIGELDFEDAVEAFKVAVRAGADADFILFETFSDTYEIKAALLAAKEAGNLPYAVTVMLDENGRLLTGGDGASAAVLAESLGAFAVGLNCGQGPDIMKKLLPAMAESTSLPLIVNSNAGLPRVENGVTVFDVSPDKFAEDEAELVKIGACAVGGCCGTSPAHIEKVVALLRGVSPITREVTPHTCVSSYTHTVNIDVRPVMIGERVNPTGKPRLKEALRSGDLGYLCREALSQNAAQILDVNVGLPEIDEKETLCRAVSSIQAVCDQPLQIDTGNAAAMEAATRLYNGKPLLNSANGKRSSMDAILPIAAKYGACLVCLCLDEDGIPETADGRLRIARRIAEEADKYGIPRKNLLFDALVMTVSTGAENALVTLEALRKIKAELGVCTVLGVSNVSFGLPERSNINSAFYTMALAAGLDAGIVNPLDPKMLSVYRSYSALAACDPLGIEYIAAYSGTAQTAVKEQKEVTLADAIKQGLSSEAASCAEKLLKDGKDALEIIDGELVPALDEVGRGFENKTVFLPQLLMSAEAAKAAFGVIREHIANTGSKGKSKGKIVIATVEGDIHDIGKNIVRALLENYGFDVIDLGKDVPCEKVVEEAKKHGVRLVALSALMTTTVPAMEKTIALLKKELPDCATLVGGAVLNEEYSQMISATAYAKDAMASVRFALEFFGK